MSAERLARIAWLTPGFSASEADWCIPALLDLARALAGRVELRVFALRYPHTRRPYAVHAARVTPFGAAQSRGFGRVLMWARLRAALRREQARAPFDALHALWAHEPGGLATLFGRALGVPVVVSVLGGELVDLASADYGGQRTPVNRRLVARALRDATRVTVGTRLLAERARRLGVRDERLDVWPLGVDTARFSVRVAVDLERARARSAGGLVLDGQPALLNVASLTPVKDHATLLRAFLSLRARYARARLHLVGDGPLRARLLAFARQAGLEAAVTFHGALPHDALPALYRQADLFVLSSLFESQCLAALEAAASGCVLSGTAVGVLPELTHGACLAEPGDATALAAACEHALEHSAERRLAPRFELRACADALLALYARVRVQGAAG